MRPMLLRHKTDLRIVLSVALAMALSAKHSLAQTPAYTVAELPSTGQVIVGLNNLGDLVGRAGNRATIWSRGTFQPTQLGVWPGGDSSSASAISDAGNM